MSIELLLYGCFGSFAQELLHWYELRFDINKEEYNKLLKSAFYWIIVFATIVCAGIFTSMWVSSLQNVRPMDAVIFGAAFPLMFKKVVATAMSKQETKLGKSLPDLYFRGH